MPASDGQPDEVSATAQRKVPIAEQVEDVGRAIRSLQHYPGRMKPETVEAKVQKLSAAHATLSLIAEYADGLRILITYLRRLISENGGVMPDIGEDFEPSAMELAAITSSEAVAFVLEKFPDAVIGDVRPTGFKPVPGSTFDEHANEAEVESLAS